MSALRFEVQEASGERHAAVPTIRFRLRVDAPELGRVDSIALRCQIRIEPRRRRYSEEEKMRLRELFGEPPRWGDTLQPFLWTHATTLVPAFEGSTELDLPVGCTYDFDVAAAKYLHSLGDGEIPLILLFSGTVFAKGPSGLRVVPVSWDCEARHRLPVAVWRGVMDHYFPNAGWLRLRRDVLDGLLRFKADRALVTFDEVIETLLAEARSGRAA